MASGILGSRDGDDTAGTVYTVPSSTLAVVNINVANTSTSADDVIIYICESGETPGTVNIIDSLSLGAKSTIERTNIVLEAASFVAVNSSANTVTNVYGIEESV